jgi:hypothetical protein
VEHHDAVTDMVHDRSKSVSDASHNDADESEVREVSFVSGPPSVPVSSPSFDNENKNHTTISPPSQSTTPLEKTVNGAISSKTASPTSRTEAGLSPQLVVRLPLPNDQFKCPKCPRQFHSLVEVK